MPDTVDDAVVLQLQIEHNPSTGYFYVTSNQPRGLLVADATLAQALAKVPRALADLRAAGEAMPNLKDVKLP